MYDDVVVVAKKSEQNGQPMAGENMSADSTRPGEPLASTDVTKAAAAGVVAGHTVKGKPETRRGTVAKVSHTLSIALAERLEEFAFFQRVSESAVIEHSLAAFFAQSNDDVKLGDQLRLGGAGRRRKSV